MSLPEAKRRKREAAPTMSAMKITDSRFANIQSDPRYRLPGKRQKIKVDKRFAKALQDEDFSRKAKVDRYGRPLDADSERKRLKRKYEFEEEDREVELGSDDADDDDEVQAELRRVEATRDILREGRNISSSEDESSSSEESEDETNDEVDEIGPGVKDVDVPMGEVSSRLAVVNLDWDNIRAEDLMAVFQSFLPATGRLVKVAIYPSEFGKERMEREELEGPPKEIFAKKDTNQSSEDDEEEDEEDIKNTIVKPDDGSEFDSTALRQYQLDRLRYFYAVLTFSNKQAAKAVYDSVDGTEYLSTANFFDLRFVPDETDFSEDRSREECERIPAGYKPNEFVTDALQHSKVKLTWDADDAIRKEAQARAFKRGRKDFEDDDDLKVYLGTDSESEDEERKVEGSDRTSAATGNGLSRKEAERQRMRALLGLAPEPVKHSRKDKNDRPLGNIQVTFSSGLSGLASDQDLSTDEDSTLRKTKKKRSVFENSPEPIETTVEKYVRREKERKQRRKEKMKANRKDTDVNTTTTEPAKDKDATDEEMGFEDPFFAEPSHDAKSATKQRKADRLKRRAEREAEEAASAKQRAELEALMADNDDEKAKTGRTVKHFDMNEIEKAEKAMSKSKKRRKDGPVDHEAILAADEFSINIGDPRFARLYENHEFAIDPTNPRFKGTKGMKALLEEGRKRKGQELGKDEKAVESSKKQRKKDKVAQASEGRDNGIMGLVHKIKKRKA